MNWIVCIARNSLPLTKNALRSFLEQDIGNIGVAVIDNNSTDGTTEWLMAMEGWDQRVCRVPVRDRSVAYCWNLALRHHFQSGSNYVLVANNDVELRPETYRLLVEDGGSFVTAVGVSERDQMTDATLEPKNKRPHPDFSCFLVRREVWDAGFRFDERYEGAYGEDCQAHVELHRMGTWAECIGVPFYHVASGTLKHADEAEQERIRQCADKNRELFKSLWGCYPGTSEYEALFSPETFGIDKKLVPSR